MKKGRKSTRLVLPMKFDEAVSDFLKVPPPPKKSKKQKARKPPKSKMTRTLLGGAVQCSFA